MLQKKSILLALFFVAIIFVLAYLAYPVIKDRYFIVDSEEQQNELLENTQQNTTADSAADEEDASEISEEKSAEEFAKEDAFLDITRENCENDCKGFEDQEDTDYCKQVCGLVVLEKKENCDGLEDLEKDYCLKDLAISKTDTKICKKIDDKNIRKTCENRIMEDIVDKEMESRATMPIPE